MRRFITERVKSGNINVRRCRAVLAECRRRSRLAYGVYVVNMNGIHDQRCVTLLLVL